MDEQVENKRKFIVTANPSVFFPYHWTIEDSIDGVIYDTFEDALAQVEILGGWGVAELWS